VVVVVIVTVIEILTPCIQPFLIVVMYSEKRRKVPLRQMDSANRFRTVFDI
jgi:Na+-transporting methylmalonyl-CoA/oxaloacetate decarboxylase beta subunit